MLSAYRHVVTLRTIRPQPTVEMNPEDVKKYGLEEGDWVNVWLLIEEWGLLGRKVKAGELGRKPGRGWYEYHPDGSRPNGNRKEK